jgi:hypothetical protein
LPQTAAAVVGWLKSSVRRAAAAAEAYRSAARQCNAEGIVAQQRRAGLWVMLGLLVLAMASCADRHAPAKQEQESPQPFGKLSRAEVGMTVEQVEKIMGNPGQKGTVRGESGEYLAWNHVDENGKAVKVWIEVKDGKVSSLPGRGGFRPKSDK